MKALICVDVQADFMPAGDGQDFEGALAVENGREVIKPLLDISHSVGLIIASADWHPVNHISFATDLEQGWPVHCVANTQGAKIAPEIESIADLIIHKATEKEQDAYSAFKDTDLASFLKERHVEEIIIGGLATDYCVLNTALDAVSLGYKVTVPLAACRGVSQDTTQVAIKQMKASGINVI